MKRKALIISYPGKVGADNYCNGVYVDANRYKEFLTSPLGGAWYESEVKYLDTPSRDSVLSEIDALKQYDYTMVFFSGHGYYSRRSESTILEINNNEVIDSMDFRRGSTKRSIIVDACRQVYEEPVFEAARKAMKFAEARANFDSCRRYYETLIDKCSSGVVVGYACGVDETAGESSSRGGYYSSSLVKTSEEWSESGHFDLSSHYYHQSIVKVHNSAALKVNSLSGGTQHPEIDKPRSEPYFPFAIMA